MSTIEQPGSGGPYETPPTGASLPEQWHHRRLRLREWLSATAPHLEPVYVAAVLMADDPEFPGRVWLVAHAVREIRNRLPDALTGPVSAPQVPYSRLAGIIRTRWIEAGLPSAGVAPLGADEHLPPPDATIPRSLLDAVGELVAEHERGAETNRERARRMFDAMGDGVAPAYVVRGWLDATGWAPEYAHVRNDPLPPDVDAMIETYFNQFEDALFAMSAYSFENLDEIDALLGSANI